MHKLASIAGWLAIAAIVVALDQVTKMLVEHALPLGSSVFVAPVLDLVHVRNTGAAFSFLASASGWQRELFIGIAFAASIWIIWMLVRAERGQRVFCIALSLILGGALGNVVDRVRLGGVIDFLYFHWGPHYWPAFNVADSAITCGAILLIIDAFRTGARHRQQSTGGGPDEERRPRQPT
jgi:signal peptidase II